MKSLELGIKMRSDLEKNLYEKVIELSKKRQTELIKEGKYSKTSNEFKEQFQKIKRIVTLTLNVIMILFICQITYGNHMMKH